MTDLNEISKETIKKYVDGAISDYGDRKVALGRDPESYAGSDNERKAINRRLGINRAVRRLARKVNEEPTELVELSRNLVQRYKDKAASQIDNSGVDGTSGSKKIQKRQYGNLLAYKKLRGDSDVGVQEEAPANNAGDGAIAGIGVGLKGEPGVKKAILKKMLKRNNPTSIHENVNDDHSNTISELPKFKHTSRYGKHSYPEHPEKYVQIESHVFHNERQRYHEQAGNNRNFPMSLRKKHKALAKEHAEISAQHYKNHIHGLPGDESYRQSAKKLDERGRLATRKSNDLIVSMLPKEKQAQIHANNEKMKRANAAAAAWYMMSHGK